MKHYVFRGVVYYLDKQTERLGIPQVVGHRARNNVEAGNMATLLSQLTDRHKHGYRPDGPDSDPVFHPPELAIIRGVMDRGEGWLQQLHVLAASAQAMFADAYAAFGLEPPKRLFEILCDRDAPAPVGPPAAIGVVDETIVLADETPIAEAP